MGDLGAVVRRVSRRVRSTVGGAAPATEPPLTESESSLLDLLRPSLGARARPRVVVLKLDQAAGTPHLLRRELDSVKAVKVSVLDAGLDDSALHVRLAAVGRPDAVVLDPSVDGTRHVDLFERVFPHLRRGGTFLVRDYESGVAVAERGGAETLAALVTAVRERDLVDRSELRGPGQRDRHRLVSSVGTVTVRGGHLAMTATGQASAKLTEPETNELLRLRPARGRVLEVLPATELRSRATVRSSPGGLADWEVERYQVPDLSLREYHDVTCLPGQVLAQRNVLLADTFRHNQHRRLRSNFVQERAPRFARHEPAQDAEHLEGAYFHLDSEFRGHFGHAVTEQLSRLWAWEEAKRLEPSLKALMLENLRTHLAEYEVLLYAAAGVAPEDLVLVKGPVTVDRLYAATPMFSQPAYVHPGVEAVWERTGSRLAAAAPERAYPEKVFCSRRHAMRPCHNVSEVEEFFANRGFEVIYPEDFDLPEQTRIFREARVIGGFAGSGLFHTMLCDIPKHVVMVCSDAYTAKNEQMIAAVRGHRVDVAWCRSDALRPEVGWSKGTFHSPFTFDVTREGAWLDTVLHEADGPADA